jgi:hypothetical protein
VTNLALTGGVTILVSGKGYKVLHKIYIYLSLNLGIMGSHIPAK